MSTAVFVLGLTGSIGMGKSTTAGFFREMGVPVWDADAAVHRLYAKGGAAVEAIRALCPDAVDEDGVNRASLREWIAADEKALAKIENVVHPLVAEDRRVFLQKAKEDGDLIVVVDIPLLFETRAEASVDAVLVVSAPKEVQKKRVMERAGMTEAHFKRILASQMPDADKRARADFVIETVSLDEARLAVKNLLRDLESRMANHA